MQNQQQYIRELETLITRDLLPNITQDKIPFSKIPVHLLTKINQPSSVCWLLQSRGTDTEPRTA